MRYTNDIREVFEAKPDTDISLEQIRRVFPRVSVVQIQSAMSRLRAMDVRYSTVQRGKVWRLNTGSNISPRPRAEIDDGPRRAKARVKMSISNDHPLANDRHERRIVGSLVSKVPASEPPVEFRVLGTTVETGELVLSGVSASVSGVWMARRVS